MLLPGSRSLAHLVIVALLIAVPAWAEDQEANLYTQPGFYLAALGTLSLQIQSEEDFAEAYFQGQQERGDVDESWGATGRAGYRFLPRLAVEGDFTWLPDRDFESLDITTNRINKGVSRSWATTLGAKFFLLTGAFQPYVSAGAGWQRIETKVRSGPAFAADRSITDAGIVAKGAAGFDLYPDPDVALTFEGGYLAPTGSISHADQLFFNMGLTLRFYGLD